MSSPSPERSPLRRRLLSRLLDWVDSFVPSLGERPDIVLKERILIGSSVALAAIASGFGLQAVALQGAIGGISLLLWSGALLALSYPWLQRTTGSVKLPGTLLCLEFIGLLGLVALMGNGFDGPVLVWAPGVPLLAAFFVGPRGAAAVALLGAAEIGLLFWLDQAGLGPVDAFAPERLERVRLMALLSGLGFSFFLGWLYESQTLRGLRRVNHELREAKERAEASERLKSALLMNMSHEVRTPLTGIMGIAEILQEETTGELAELAGSIHTNGARLFSTLDAVLDLAQIEGGALTVHPAPFDLSRCLRQAVETHEPAAARKGLALSLEADGFDPIIAVADPARTRRILDLLLDNALKFTERGGVTVRLGTDRGRARVVVEDTGVGISADFLPHVFEAFRQESDGLARTHEGTGLGLALAQRLAVLQQGTLAVASTKGQGSAFILGLPLAPPSAAPHRAPATHSTAVLAA